jgi:deoxyribodipyrimidine photolyase-like uncharacterized protein
VAPAKTPRYGSSPTNSVRRVYGGECAFDPKQRLGEYACPFTVGFWAVSSMQRLSDVEAVVEQETKRQRF